MDAIIPAIILVTAISSGSDSVTEMEKLFWDCEFAAVHGTIDLDTGAGCSEIYEALKQKKFRGNFENFLIWWRTHKAHEISLRTKPARPMHGKFLH